MKTTVKIISIIILVAVFLWLFLFLNIYLNSNSDDREKVDAIVVLGASQWNGRPSPVLKARLDRANQLYRQRISKNIVLTGGIAEGDTISESRVGKNYLVKKGVPNSAILIEEQGRTTKESMDNITELLTGNNFYKLLFVSHGYHIYRVKRIARDNGFSDIYASAVEVKDRDLKYKYIARESFINFLYMINPKYTTAKK